MRSADAKSQSTTGPGSPAAGGKRQARPRTKVKTGCKTCKIRKVKCDEGRPACTRCSATGRVCQGYGVWGGGSTDAPSSISTAAAVLGVAHQRRPCPVIPRHILAGTLAPLSSQEHGWLEWFRCRTAVKLRGAFSMAFWDVLVIRASLEEPAILHAALALSTVHKRVGGGDGQSPVVEDGGEEFTLRQYNKAIHYLTAAGSGSSNLHSLAATRDVASTRVVLVACMLFTCLEFMRGHFQTGNNHLQNGIRLLAGLHTGPGRRETDPYHAVIDRRYPRSDMDPTDQWLLEAFARMNLLAAQLGHGYSGPLLPSAPQYFFSPDHQLLALPITFSSVSQARNALDQLVYDVFTLTGQCRQLQSSSDPRVRGHLVKEQARIGSDLHAWGSTYRASRVGLHSQLDLLSKVAYRMLLLFYDMATILVETCLDPDNELAFDAYGHQFLSILRNALLFIKAVQAVHNSQDPNFKIDPEVMRAGAEAGAPICLFNADVGWTPPLYFTALHCRLSRVRKQAARFMQSIPSREGMWDSKLSSVVALEVIRLEEGDLSGAMSEADKEAVPFFDGDLFQDDRCLPLQPLPASHPRIHSVHVVLPDSWSGTTTLACEKRRSDGICEAIKRVYDPVTEEWTSL